MGELAVMVADALGPRGRVLALDLETSEQVVADGPAWSRQGCLVA